MQALFHTTVRAGVKVCQGLLHAQDPDSMCGSYGSHILRLLPLSSRSIALCTKWYENKERELILPEKLEDISRSLFRLDLVSRI